jgi:hypothetical protein
MGNAYERYKKQRIVYPPVLADEDPHINAKAREDPCQTKEES